jgi:hypothetical protein
MYRIEIHHTREIDGIPVAHLDAMTAEWLAFPKWKRILRRAPLTRIGTKLTIEVEPIDGSYESADDAFDAAQNAASNLTGVIRNDSAVAIIRESDGVVMGGVHPANGGRF